MSKLQKANFRGRNAQWQKTKREIGNTYFQMNDELDNMNLQVQQGFKEKGNTSKKGNK